MSLSKITAWGAGIAGALLVAALLALLVLFTVEIPVNLDPLKGDVCERLSQALGRKVTLDVKRYLPFRQDNTIIDSGLSVKANWTEDTVGQFPSSI